MHWKYLNASLQQHNKRKSITSSNCMMTKVLTINMQINKKNNFHKYKNLLKS